VLGRSAQKEGRVRKKSDVLGKRGAIYKKLHKNSNPIKVMNTYLISGHGYENVDSFFPIPKGCYVVVTTKYADITYYTDYAKRVDKLHKMENHLLQNPTAYSSELRHQLGSLVIYTEGQLCPNFKYHLLHCFKEDRNSPDFTSCSSYGSGVIDIQKFKEKSYPFRKLTPVKNSINPVETIASMYKNSVYPTSDDIHSALDEKRYNKQLRNDIRRQFRKEEYGSDNDNNHNINENEVNYEFDIQKSKITLSDRLNALRMLHLTSKLDVTQETLCNLYPGVYYNFVCRNIPHVSESIALSIALSHPIKPSNIKKNLPIVKAQIERIRNAEQRRKPIERKYYLEMYPKEAFYKPLAQLTRKRKSLRKERKETINQNELNDINLMLEDLREESKKISKTLKNYQKRVLL
jgi:hypothetical protein